MFPPLKKLSFGFALSMERGLVKATISAFTTQIIPAYKKNPPEKPVYDAGTIAAAQLQ